MESEQKKPTKRKPKYRGYTQAQNVATQKYHNANLETMVIKVHKGRREYYHKAAAALGLSLAQFALTSMDKVIEEKGLQIEGNKSIDE